MKNKVYLILLMLIIVFTAATQEVSANRMKIILHPAGKFLFNIENMKPGDWAERTLLIKNAGSDAIDYYLRVLNKSKNNKLFNELDLQVYLKDKNTLIFDDKLRKFEGFIPKHLVKSEIDNLLFIVKMPYELGNEFQGTSAHFELRISAKADDDNELPDPPDNGDNPDPDPIPENPPGGDNESPGVVTPTPPQVDSETEVKPTAPVSSQGPKLPNTATNIYNLILIGVASILMSFLLLRVNKSINRKKE
jgi:LPXTG-motif cell wall-anchored protein